AMARAEPAVVVALLAERHAAEMRADADHHEQRLMALYRAVLVGRRRILGKILVARERIRQFLERRRPCLLDLFRRAVPDEHRLAAPHDGDRLAGFDR